MLQDRLEQLSFLGNKNEVIVFLDIGQTCIRACAARFNGDFSAFAILFCDKKVIHTVADQNILKECILNFIIEIEDKISCYVKKIALCVNGKYLNFGIFSASKDISSEGKVSSFHIRSTVEKVILAYQKIYPNDTILDVIDSEYLIGGGFKDVNPIGLETNSFEVNLSVVSSLAQNVQKLINNFSDYSSMIVDCAPISLCVASCCKNPLQSGVSLITHIGSKEVSYAVCGNGFVYSMGSIAVGGDKITEAIAHSVKTSFDNGEKIKLVFGDIMNIDNSTLNENKTLRIEIDQTYSFSQLKMAQVFKEAIEYLCAMLKTELKDVSFDDIIVTGGTAAIFGVDKIMGLILGKQSQNGHINNPLLINALRHCDISHIDNIFAFMPVLGAPVYLIEKKQRCKRLLYGKGAFGLFKKILLGIESYF